MASYLGHKPIREIDPTHPYAGTQVTFNPKQTGSSTNTSEKPAEKPAETVPMQDWDAMLKRVAQEEGLGRPKKESTD